MCRAAAVFVGLTLKESYTKTFTQLISNFRRVLNVVYFLLGNSPASEFYMPTFRNSLSVPPMKMEQADCSETSAYKIQTPANYPEESIQHSINWFAISANSGMGKELVRKRPGLDVTN
jgi:hypothetical protein